MKRWFLVGMILVALGLARPPLFAQNAAPPDVRKPFTLDDDGKPIPRAVPVEKPIPRAIPVEKLHSTPKPATPPAPPPPAKPAAPAATPAPPEPEDPGAIYIRPSTVAKPPDQIQIDLADGLYAKKMYDMAAPEYEKYLGLYPNGADKPQALFRLGESYRHNGAFNAAKNAYENLLLQFQNGDFIGPASYRLAEIYYQGKQFRDAVTMYRKASVRLKDPAVVNSAKFFSARALEALGDKLDARAAYEDLVGSPGNNPFRDASRLSLALLFKDSGRITDALKHIQTLAKQAENPELKIEATVRSGLWELEVQPPQMTQAEADFKSALAMAVQSRWKDVAQLGLLRIFFEAGKYQLVIDAYEKNGAQFPADLKPEVLMLAANSCRQLGKTPDAVKYYDQILREFPASDFAKDAQFERLRAFYATDDAGLGPEIDKYIAANPDAQKRDEALLMKAELFFRKQDYQNAMPIYSTLELSRQLNGTRKAEVLFRLGWCQTQLHDLDHATKAFSAFIDGYPGNKLIPYALIQRGIAYQSQKNLAAALKDYDALIRNYPKARERQLALQQKALIQGQQEDNAGMAESFRLLLKDYPNTSARAQADYWIGWASYSAKNYKECVPYLEEARKLDPEQFLEKASIRLLMAQYNLEDKAAAAREVDLYAKEGKTQVPPEILRWLGKEFRSGEPAAAEKYLQLLTPRDEAVPDDFLFLGQVEDELGKYQPAVDALKTYLKSVKVPRLRAEGLLTLAKSQIGLKTLDEAQNSVDEALTLQPEGEVNGRARIVAGDIQMARANFLEAAKLYESVAVILDHDEITPSALEKAVEAWKSAGDEAKAKKTLNTLQSRYPEYLQRKRTTKTP